MTDITKFTRHLPTVIETQRLNVETVDSSEGRYFVRLKLAGNDLWVQGTPVWHNRMTLPDCFVRNVVNGGIYEAGLTISHWHKPYRIWLSIPRITKTNVLDGPCGPWNFIGFPEHSLVDIEFVRNDAERLEKEDEMEDIADLKFQRPAGGNIV